MVLFHTTLRTFLWHIVVKKEDILAKALSELNVANTSAVAMDDDRRHDVEAATCHS